MQLECVHCLSHKPASVVFKGDSLCDDCFQFYKMKSEARDEYTRKVLEAETI